MPKRRALATQIVEELQDAGFTAYFAGGWVRDFLMQRPSDDIDIATDATVEQIQDLFPKTIPVGVAFGIVIVVKEGVQFEVATFRKDRGYVDGRRPTGIDRATPEEDATRRDFTINGMFYDPIKEKLYDWVHGKKDLELKVIRAIGNAEERFAEDRLRMMRAVRYATRFNFTIDDKTLDAIRLHSQELIPAVAMERIWQEFKKMSQFAHFDTGLILLHELGLLPSIFPELKGVSSSEIRKRVRFIERFPKGSPTFAELLELFPSHNLEDVYKLSEYLKLSNKEQSFAKFYYHAKSMFAMPKEWLAKLENYEWVKFYADKESEIGIHMIAAHLPEEEKEKFLKEQQERQEQLKIYIYRYRGKEPFLRAEHLLKAGIPPGEKMGKLLEEGWRVAINQGLESPEAILAKIKL